MDLAEQTEKTLLAADMRLCLDVNTNPRFRRIQGVAALALLPFFSAIVFDSHNYIMSRSPETAKAIRPNREVLADSRLRIKPLEIHGKRFEEILEETDRLAKINSGWFMDSHPRLLKPVYRILQKDLGVFFMGGEIVSTTHLSLMNLGVTEETLKAHSLSLHNLGPFMSKVTEDYGGYVADLYVALAGEYPGVDGVQEDYTRQMLALGEAFTLVTSGEYKDDSKVDGSLSIPYRDFHSEPFYERLAKTRGREQTAVFILLLAAMSQVNVARVLIPTVSEGNSLSALKVRFLSLYHAAQTLNRLSNESQRSDLMYPEALQCIRNALGEGPVRKVRKMKNLRNNFIHYGIDKHIARRLSERLPLAGLIEAHTGGDSMADLWNEVSAGLDHVGGALRPLLPDDLASRARVD